MAEKEDRLSLEGNNQKYDTNFDRCIVCQNDTSENLVFTPSLDSTTALLNAIKLRSGYGETIYPEIWKRLQKLSANDINDFHGGSWHRTCYQNSVNKNSIKYAKRRYESTLNISSEPSSSSSAKRFLRSNTEPRKDKKSTCFFCDEGGTDTQKLYQVTHNKTNNNKRGRDLKAAIEKANAEHLKVKLCEAIDPNDALAIDVMYHYNCWRDNVDHVLRKKVVDQSSEVANKVADYCADIEFFTLLRRLLDDGQKISMKEVEVSYERIRKECGVSEPAMSRRSLKRMIMSRYNDIEFHQPERKNESELISCKSLRDKLVDDFEDTQSMERKIESLFTAAKILRKLINESPRWEFNGSFDNFDEEYVPTELNTFFRWVCVGPNKTLASNDRETSVKRRVSSLSQKVVSLCLTDRQVNNKTSNPFRTRRQTPEEIAVVIIIRQAFRNKRIFGILSRFNVSRNYKFIYNLEIKIASTVLKRIAEHNGIYIPPGFVQQRHIFFAADNVDFQEDTLSGKVSLHGTAMAIYQQIDDKDEPPEYLDLSREGVSSLIKVPEIFTPMLSCNMPKKPRPLQPIYPTKPEMMPPTDFNHALTAENSTFLAKVMIRNRMDTQLDLLLPEHILEASGNNFDVPLPIVATNPAQTCKIHSWSSLNSLILTQHPQTRVACPPLIAAPAHEFNTLLTVLKQAQGISAIVMGESKKTVISLDLGLYHPAKQLQMSRNDLNSIILRIGELHVEMAMHRTIGAYVEDSGIDLCWEESGVFGEGAVHTILAGKHVKRGKCAHIETYQALLALYSKSFFHKNKDIYLETLKSVEKLNRACDTNNEDEIRKAFDEMQTHFEKIDIETRMQAHDKTNKDRPMFGYSRQYMKMVLEMLVFLKSVRTGDWDLHLAALKAFCQYFFAFDKLYYARLVPLYIADMQQLKVSDPDIYSEFVGGNWVVNKNPDVSFCCIGADHALEQVNRMMKVSGGLVGITLNASARNRFFLTAPHMALLAEQAENMVGTPSTSTTTHHESSSSFTEQRELDIFRLTEVFERYGNPFEDEGETLVNFVTKKVVSPQVQHDLLNCAAIGNERYKTFVEERIQSNTVNLWSLLSKAKLNIWKSGNKKSKFTTADAKIIELTEDRALFGRMAIISKSRPELNLKETIGDYEFSVVPRSLFAADGTMLYCSTKSILYHCVVDKSTIPDHPIPGPIPLSENIPSDGPSVIIVDAMADVQALEKDDSVEICSDLANVFVQKLFRKYSPDKCDILYIVFDRYDIKDSLKSSTRKRRQGGRDPTAYRITENMKIKNISMKKLLSHVSTKNELTVLFSDRILKYSKLHGRSVIVLYSNKADSTFKDVNHLWNSHEEADTKMMLCAKDATVCGASRIEIHSPDSDVLFIALRRYPDLCKYTFFVTGKGGDSKTLALELMYNSLKKRVCNALPGLHALSGADVTGSFAGKGKKSWWNVFETATSCILSALSLLGYSETLEENVLMKIEEFVCRVYAPKSDIKTVSELRWAMLKKNQTTSEGLPPTRNALRLAISRANYQCIIWANDTVPYPQIPSPSKCGWKLEDDKWVEILMTIPPAPEAVMSLVRCNCDKTRCGNNHCSCRKVGLKCTELCRCSAEEDDCENCKIEEEHVEDEGENGDDEDNSEPVFCT